MRTWTSPGNVIGLDGRSSGSENFSRNCHELQLEAQSAEIDRAPRLT